MSSKYTAEDLVNSSFHFMKEADFDLMIKDFVDKWMDKVGKISSPSACDISIFADAVPTGLSLIRKLNEDGYPIKLADGSHIDGMHRESNLLLMSRLAEHHFKPKNTDYGDAFERFGVSGILIRMDDKVLRIKSLMSNKAKVTSESMADTIVDFTVYAMMALMLAKRQIDQDEAAVDSDLTF